MKDDAKIEIRPATEDDVSLIRRFVEELSEYEKLRHEMVATDEDLRRTLFGERRYAEVVFLEEDGEEVAFALFFHNYSTFLGKPGLYLEDLYVRPAARGRGHGRRLLAHLAEIAVERGCGRMEWWVLDWNDPAIRFYERIGAVAMDEWTTFRLAGEALEGLAARTRS